MPRVWFVPQRLQWDGSCAGIGRGAAEGRRFRLCRLGSARPPGSTSPSRRPRMRWGPPGARSPPSQSATVRQVPGQPVHIPDDHHVDLILLDRLHPDGTTEARSPDGTQVLRSHAPPNQCAALPAGCWARLPRPELVWDRWHRTRTTIVERLSSASARTTSTDKGQSDSPK